MSKQDKALWCRAGLSERSVECFLYVKVSIHENPVFPSGEPKGWKYGILVRVQTAILADITKCRSIGGYFVRYSSFSPGGHRACFTEETAAEECPGQRQCHRESHPYSSRPSMERKAQ